MNKKFWATTFTLSGAIIGAGILGLPYVFEQSGFLVGVFWLVIIGLIMIFINLAMGEITLRTKGFHQLPGYAEKYTGVWGKRIMLAAVLFGVYSALLAYLVGEGQSLSKIMAPNTPPIFFGIGFWLVLTPLLREGLKGLKKIETWGILAVITIILGIFIRFLPQISTQNLVSIFPQNILAPIGIVMFALFGFIAIPELREEIKGQEHLLKRAIIIGSTIPIILYTIFSLTFIGVLGHSITEVATLSFGPIITLLGIFTMFTSYFVLSYSLKTTFKLDIKMNKTMNFMLTSLVPLVMYILTERFKIISFTSILSIGGVISGGIAGTLILLMAKKAKSTNITNERHKIQMPINLPIIIILSLFFLIAIILELI